MTCYDKNIVPPRIITYGDHVNASRYIGVANSVLSCLRDTLRSNNLNRGVLSSHKIQGVKIICKIINKDEYIYILVGKDAGGKIKKYYKCWCTCNFSYGEIIELTDIIPTDVQTYTVKACNLEKTYKLFTNVIASDFSPYVVGQRIILMAYYEMLYDCCNFTFDAQGCEPIESLDLVEADAWRTTYRILPICSDVIRKWYDDMQRNAIQA